MVRGPHVFNILTWKRASRHSGMPFGHRNFMVRCHEFFNILPCKCASHHSSVPFFDIWTSKSDSEVFCTFWPNVLRAAAACPFSVHRGTATSAPAALATLLFEHLEPRIIQETRDFPNISRLCIVFVPTFSHLWFLLLSWLLYSSFFNWPYCRKIDFQRSFDYIVLCSTY